MKFLPRRVTYKYYNIKKLTKQKKAASTISFIKNHFITKLYQRLRKLKKHF